jgi:UDP-N-acetylglucosamine acyltransferase
VKAHPTAIVDPGATVAPDVDIGPFCVVGPGARVGPGCRLGTRVTLQGNLEVGRDNRFHDHVTIGVVGGGRIEIGDGNVLRESTHVDPPAPGAVTRIGSRNRFGTWVGIGAGSEVGDDVWIGSLCMLGERTVVQDEARLEGQCVIEPGVRIGRASLIRSQVPVTSPVPPFMCLDGNPAEIQGVNPHRRIHLLEIAYQIVYKSGLSFLESARKLREMTDACPEVRTLAGFLERVPPSEASIE